MVGSGDGIKSLMQAPALRVLLPAVRSMDAAGKTQGSHTRKDIDKVFFVAQTSGMCYISVNNQDCEYTY